MKQKLNLGCGREKLVGFDNIDISPKCNPDFVWDVTKIPYPEFWAKTGMIQRIECDNICEHIEAYTLIKLINYWHSLLTLNGTLWIKVPLCRTDNFMAAFSDPTHINYFTEQTFGYFRRGSQRHQTFGKDYGIIGWANVKQEISLPFLIVTLIK